MKLPAILAALLLCVCTASAQSQADDEVQKEKDILAYGLDSEITELIKRYISESNFLYANEVESVFNEASSSALKQSCIEYFTAAKDARLSAYALSVAEDPYDESSSLVSAVFKYIAALDLKEAAPAARKLLDDDQGRFFDPALEAIGALGSAEDAVFLTELLDRADMTTARRQAIMRALAKLKAPETADRLAAIASDENENVFVRIYAADALGNIGRPEDIGLLTGLFDSSDANLRAQAVKSLANYSQSEAEAAVVRALRDNQYKVRLEAVAAIKARGLSSQSSMLVYRAANDAESAVRYACYDALASLGSQEGLEFLVSVLKDPQKGDAAQVRAAASLLQYGRETDAVIALAREVLTDNKRKNLRYALGREFARVSNPTLADICLLYLESDDAATRGTGLDIYAKNRFPSATARVQEIADAEKADANRSKARRILSEAQTQG